MNILDLQKLPATKPSGFEINSLRSICCRGCGS